MTTSTTPSIALSPAEIGSLPAPFGFDFAHSLAKLGRMSDARDALLHVDWTKEPQGMSALGHGRLFMRGVQVALGIGAHALEDFLAAAGRVDPSTLSYSRDRLHCLTQEKQLACGLALDHALRTSPELAMILVEKAPSWVCLHGDVDDFGRNFFTEMLPRMSRDLLLAILARGGFGERLAQSCSGKKQPWADESYRKFIERMRQAIPRPRHVDLMAELLAHTLPLIAAERRSSNAGGPLLPETWMQSLMLSSWPSLRREAVAAFGLRACLDDLLALDNRRQLCIQAASSGSVEAVGIALECFGASFFNNSQQDGSGAPIVAMMISRMPILEFKSTIADISKRGLMANLAEDCAARFWAFIESPSRKKGDALALCVATGKADHAQALISAIPTLSRRAASEMAAYVNSRPVANRQTASIAWEKIIIADTVDAMPSSAPSASSTPRLRL